MTAPKNRGFFSRQTVFGATVGGAIVFFFLGIIFWGGFNTAMEATNTLEFCTGCHEMEENVYQEYRQTVHYANRTGVRTICPDCHVPSDWYHQTMRKIEATRDLWAKFVLHSVDTPEKFEAHRLVLAQRVWKMMKESDSRECRNCHDFESMNPRYQSPKAGRRHLDALNSGQTCIDCHKGIAHKDVRNLLGEEMLAELEKPDPKFVREVPGQYLAGLKEAEEEAAKGGVQEAPAAIREKPHGPSQTGAGRNP